jgi:hypothetical protein
MRHEQRDRKPLITSNHYVCSRQGSSLDPPNRETASSFIVTKTELLYKHQSLRTFVSKRQKTLSNFSFNKNRTFFLKLLIQDVTKLQGEKEKGSKTNEFE